MRAKRSDPQQDGCNLLKRPVRGTNSPLMGTEGPVTATGVNCMNRGFAEGISRTVSPQFLNDRKRNNNNERKKTEQKKRKKWKTSEKKNKIKKKRKENGRDTIPATPLRNPEQNPFSCTIPLAVLMVGLRAHRMPYPQREAAQVLLERPRLQVLAGLQVPLLFERFPCLSQEHTI